ncbi:hypothetical protein [Streptomyces sp. TS71-3]|uniref:hypothetical protein n=1 Tax=Streptomyces sp. TS71-3 TaxID=2733862 RepID=UPI001B09B780|nr:hypothetical protein Sm713_59710 [Streptomyces sp. TS71-3]
MSRQIDHVIVSADFSARHARFLKLPGTDHRALLADLVLHSTPHPAPGMEPASPDRP